MKVTNVTVYVRATLCGTTDWMNNTVAKINGEEVVYQGVMQWTFSPSVGDVVSIELPSGHLTGQVAEIAPCADEYYGTVYEYTLRDVTWQGAWGGLTGGQTGFCTFRVEFAPDTLIKSSIAYEAMTVEQYLAAREATTKYEVNDPALRRVIMSLAAHKLPLDMIDSAADALGLRRRTE